MKKHAKKHATPSDMEHRKSGKQMFSTVKLLSLLLCMVLIFAALAACGDDDGDDADIDDSDASIETPEGEAPPEEEESGFIRNHSERVAANLEEAMTTFDRDAIMISAGDEHIIWAEFYALLYSTIANFSGFFENTVDWSEVVHGEMTLAEAALDMATEGALNLLVFRFGASTIGAWFDQEELDRMADDMQGIIEHYGSLEILTEALRVNYGFYDFETFESIIITEQLFTPILNTLYGEYGAALPDEVAEEFADREGFLMAKHILVSFAENENAREIVDEIYETLRPRANDDDFEEFFTELMFEHSDDNPEAVPGGYLFQAMDMVAPFSEAATELDYGEMSEVVETTFGYHIILRIPVDFDAVPISIATQGMSHTLRQVAASDNFQTVTQQWREEMNPVFSELYQSIDLARIFAWLEE